MILNDIEVMFGGQAGDGSLTTGDLIASAARRKLSGDDPAAAAPEMKKAAERILGTLGELKGAALKLGQALAMDPDALPAEARSVVAKLLSQAPQRMELAQVREVVTAELGAPPEELFAEFDPQPKRPGCCSWWGE